MKARSCPATNAFYVTVSYLPLLRNSLRTSFHRNKGGVLRRQFLHSRCSLLSVRSQLLRAVNRSGAKLTRRINCPEITAQRRIKLRQIVRRIGATPGRVTWVKLNCSCSRSAVKIWAWYKASMQLVNQKIML